MEKIYNQGYEIIKREQVGNKEFLLGYNPKAPEPYVTWKNKIGEMNPYWGRYHTSKENALKNFNKRVKEEKECER